MNTWLTPLDERALLAEHRRRIAALVAEAATDAATSSPTRRWPDLRGRLGLRRLRRHPRVAGGQTYAASSC